MSPPCQRQWQCVVAEVLVAWPLLAFAFNERAYSRPARRNDLRSTYANVFTKLAVPQWLRVVALQGLGQWLRLPLALALPVALSGLVGLGRPGHCQC